MPDLTAEQRALDFAEFAVALAQRAAALGYDADDFTPYGTAMDAREMCHLAHQPSTGWLSHLAEIAECYGLTAGDDNMLWPADGSDNFILIPLPPAGLEG